MPALSDVLSGQESAGFVQDEPFLVRALPFQSTAAQNDALAQETDSNPSPVTSICTGLDQCFPLHVR